MYGPLENPFSSALFRQILTVRSWDELKIKAVVDSPCVGVPMMVDKERLSSLVEVVEVWL